MVKQGDNPAQPTLKHQMLGLRYRMYLHGTGMLTGFPFGLPS